MISPDSTYFDGIRSQLPNCERSANKNPVDSANRLSDLDDCLLSAETRVYDPFPNRDAFGAQLETDVEAFSNALFELESSARRHQNRD